MAGEGLQEPYRQDTPAQEQMWADWSADQSRGIEELSEPYLHKPDYIDKSSATKRASRDRAEIADRLGVEEHELIATVDDD